MMATSGMVGGVIPINDKSDYSGNSHNSEVKKNDGIADGRRD